MTTPPHLADDTSPALETLPDFRAWLAAQRTTKDPARTGVDGADLIARIAARIPGDWSTPDELHELIHHSPGWAPWLCEGMEDTRTAYQSTSSHTTP